MNQFIQFEILRAVIIAALALACFTLSPRMQAAGGPPPNCNTCEGYQALFNVTTGTDDTAIGGRALFNDISGSDNTAIGCGALVSNTTGNHNTATGSQALSRNTGGIDNTANGYQALYNNMSVGNTAIGEAALFSNTQGLGNTASGARALYGNTSGEFNTADGALALFSNTTGINNTASGSRALYNNTNGSQSTAIGEAALENAKGSNNIAVGVFAGGNVATGILNIDIGNGGADESHTIRIGESRFQNRTFIAGIRGVATGNDDAISVVIDSAGQLGTTSSSRRFKTDIKPMNKASESILALNPVTFRHKNSNTGTPQFGLIAEDVAKVNPDLVMCDKNGEIYTVRYDAVNAMLLNEFLKEHRKNEEQEKTIAEIKSGMTALIATVKEQAVQIQKVSAQLEASKPAPQVVNNP